MNYLRPSKKPLPKDSVIGGKAENLFKLVERGMPVPKFIVIPQDILVSLVPEDVQSAESEKITAYISQVIIPQNEIDEIIAEFPGTKYFAVRSSAIDEDGVEFSFAGQFESHLFVVKEQFEEKIKRVWCSAFSERVIEYRKNNSIAQKFGIAVIIQEMVDADVAGVGFGMNPVTGNRDEKLISAVYGLGEGLVSGELNSDNFMLSNGIVTSQVAVKTHKVVLDIANSKGTRMVEVSNALQNQTSLNNAQVAEIGKILDDLFAETNQPQDIEFAYKNGQLYLLQARPITTVNKINTQKGEYILWDNSNIIESYPGITTPLTFSFISKSYETAYKLFCGFMGVSEDVIKTNERVFANTLGLINGRVYYNLKTWYHILAMLPGYSINARFMEKMMGVKERFDIPESYRLSKGKAWWSIIKMALQMYARFLSLPRKRKEFMALLEKTIAQYNAINYKEKNANELMQLYLDIERKLLNEWKVPLLNDFFAMIWFGTLQKRCEKYAFSSNPNIHNDLLCGSSDIISTQPIHRSIAIATAISADKELKNIFDSENESSIWKILSGSKNEKIIGLNKEIDRYITDFGERCIGELKLETISYTQDPVKFIKILKSYVETGITESATSGKIEEELRTGAEQEMNNGLKYHIFKKWRLTKALNNARELVSSRENLRYERSRAFGIVREIFSNIGREFCAYGIIDDQRDIFYLTKEEIFCYIEGTSVTQNIKGLIHFRKEEFQAYRQQEAPSERFATYGAVYCNNDFFSTDRVEKTEGDLKGIGCCPGRVRAKVRVILDPGEVSSLDGDILVTSSTDPGWVTLFPSASGIIVERGSLLSHSAIVSREMGKPCIVSVTGLLKTLKTGDVVEMDGSTGEIKIIQII